MTSPQRWEEKPKWIWYNQVWRKVWILGVLMTLSAATSFYLEILGVLNASILSTSRNIGGAIGSPVPPTLITIIKCVSWLFKWEEWNTLTSGETRDVIYGWVLIIELCWEIKHWTNSETTQIYTLMTFSWNRTKGFIKYGPYPIHSKLSKIRK